MDNNSENNNNNNNDNNQNFININDTPINISGRRLFSASTSFDNIMINQLTNILTNRIVNNNNTFFPLNQTNLPNNNFINILQNSLYEKNKYKKVISEKGLNDLKIITFKNTEQDIKECAITQDEFKENQKVTQLPCNHIFDSDAILTWLKEESNSCPICRFELDFKEISESKDENDTTEQISEEQNSETVENNENDVLSDSDDDMPDLIPGSDNFLYEQQQILNERRQLLSNLNSIISNVQFVSQPRMLTRQHAFEHVDNDLQEALLASIEEQKNEDFLTHPDTQHDLYFNEVLSDVDSDDDLNSVD